MLRGGKVVSRPLLYSPTGEVVATAETLDAEAKGMLVDCFGAMINLMPPNFPGDRAAFLNWLGNRIFSMVGQEAIEKRFGIKMTVKPPPGQPS